LVGFVLKRRRPGRLGFWWRTDTASEPVREAVRLHCAQAWSEYAAVLYLGRQGVSYDVPGRRRDGTRRWRHPERWLVRGGVVLVSVVLLPVLLPILLVVEVFDGVGGVDAKAWQFGQPRLSIAGDRESLAVALGDHVRPYRRDLWLVWSSTRLALVGAVADQPPRIVWQQDGAADHDVDPGSGAIDFADGSTVSFLPSDTELARLGEYADRP
jgi:hypothetical protein